MIPVEGRVLPGLDEFMLRVGHLKLLCSVVAAGGGSWRRIRQESATLLRAPVKVGFDTHSSVAEYLYRKRLCHIMTPTATEAEGKKRRCRYPDIVVRQIDSQSIAFAEFLENGSSSSIWWQDYCLAEARVRSTVGAVTTEARSGSKTGFSHVCDWAVGLELIAKNGQILPMGRLLGLSTPSDPDKSNVESNPYVLGSEIVILAYAYLIQDMDIVSRLLPRILRAEEPLTPSVCGLLFVEALEEAVADGEASRSLSAGAQQKIYQQLRDLEKVARRSQKAVGRTSTAWHRAASRFETYVDLGWLDKARLGNYEKFKYVYYANDKTTFVANTLQAASSSREWIDAHLSAIVFENAVPETCLSESTLLAMLPSVAKSLSLPTRLLPIDAVVLGIVRDASERGIELSIGLARESIDKLARNRSDVARLSRGTRGDKAEFVSLNISKIGA